MKQVRVALISFSAVMCAFACLTICAPRTQAQHVSYRPVSADRMEEVEAKVRDMQGYGERITRVEDKTNEIATNVGEITNWARGVGISICGMLIERLLRALGLRGRGASEVPEPGAK